MSVLARILEHPLAEHLTAQTLSPVHAVGGIVRDAVLGKRTQDLDLSVGDRGGALARALAERSRGTLIPLGGDRFSSYRVVADGYQADIWDRHGDSLHSDLERRDLTINAIACALDDGELEDPFGGLEDLENRTLRATKSDCFARDPLRVLRLARFRLSFEHFAIDPPTAAAARAAAPGLENVARERVRDELTRILATDSLGEAIEILRQLDVLDVLLPALAASESIDRLVSVAARLDRFSRALEPIRAQSSESTGRVWQNEDRRQAAFAVLAHAVADQDIESGAATLESRGLAPRKALKSSARLASSRVPTTAPERRLFLDHHRHRWPLALAVAAATASGREDLDVVQLGSQLAGTAAAHPGLLAGLEPLLDGHQAAELLGIAPGPELGEALAALTRAQILGEVRSRDEARDFVGRLLGETQPSKSSGRDELRSTSPKPSSAD